MRGALLATTFLFLLPFIFIKGPFFGILMWYWISLMNPQYLVWDGLSAAIPYAFVVGVCTLFSWLLLSREPRLPPVNKTTVLLGLLMIWISLTSFFGSGPSADIYDYWLLSEKMLLMTLLAFTLTYTRERLEQLILVCALSLGLLGLRSGVWVLLTGGSNMVEMPGSSMISGNNEIGVALSTMLPLLFYLQQRYNQPYFKWPLRIVLGFTVIAALFTYSRGTFLAIAVMALMVLLRSRHKLVSAIMVLLLAAGVWEYAPAQWFGRMQTINSYQTDGSAEARLYLWRLSWAMALKHPILGGGFHWSFDPVEVNKEFAGSDFHWPVGIGPADEMTPGREGELPALLSARAAHSIWFETLSDHGFPGLALFVAILLAAAFNSRWVIRRAIGRPDLIWADKLGRMLQISLAAYAVAGTFGSMNFYDGFYAVVIISAAARRVVSAQLAMEARTSAPAKFAMIRPPQSPFQQPQSIG
jgi:probable O-glycosylation ligase (exosortase A-associated)